ncbi:methionine aminopeptidase [Streptomyces sp. NBRC 110611]|uniref:hypothetical protein n=1 Tax=Streptomyces sp. NBRC 110611 TaxID=1621259 RepID=UPI0008562952|nr:hypothetical protein [Streptomyces sp. NBRC 110611]GAU71594.1 methionine aminopeptidase [Streptomyces sp. NBRC 110611]
MGVTKKRIAKLFLVAMAPSVLSVILMAAHASPRGVGGDSLAADCPAPAASGNLWGGELDDLKLNKKEEVRSALTVGSNEPRATSPRIVVTNKDLKRKVYVFAYPNAKAKLSNKSCWEGAAKAMQSHIAAPFKDAKVSGKAIAAMAVTAGTAMSGCPTIPLCIATLPQWYEVYVAANKVIKRQTDLKKKAEEEEAVRKLKATASSLYGTGVGIELGKSREVNFRDARYLLPADVETMESGKSVKLYFALDNSSDGPACIVIDSDTNASWEVSSLGVFKTGKKVLTEGWRPGLECK